MNCSKIPICYFHHHFVIISALIQICFSQTQVDSCYKSNFPKNCTNAQFLQFLTEPNCYNSNISPTILKNHQPTIIWIRVHIYNIQNEPSENLQEFKLQLLLQLRWTDFRLRYSDINEEIEKITGGEDILRRIWKPSLYLTNERSHLIGGKHNKNMIVNILPSGEVIYIARIRTMIICWGKLGKFPFDQQKCHLNIDTWKLTSGYLQLKWEIDSRVQISNYTTYLTDYRLVKMIPLTSVIDGANNCGNSYGCSSLTLVFLMAREYGFYIKEYYLPSVLIVMVSWVTFWIAPDATPGRTILGTSTMLTFFALGIDVANSLPNVSYIRSNDVWFLGCTAFIFASLAEFAFVNTIWRFGNQEVELKHATSKYIIRSSLQVKPVLSTKHVLSRSCPASPTLIRHKLKQPIDNYMTSKSMSELDISIPLSELKTMKKETFEIADSFENQKRTKMTMQEIALWIDRKSRLVFPISFVFLNIIYWAFILLQ